MSFYQFFMNATNPLMPFSAGGLLLITGLLAASFGQSHDTSRRAGKVNVGEVKLYYETSGQGQHLILIEGLGVATWLWEKQVPAFSQHFTTVVYDNRGVGQSDKPAGPYTIKMMADDLAGLMDALGIDRAHILGVSMGGFIAQDYALRYPERVDRLVLVSTSAGGATHVAPSPQVLAKFFITDPDPRRLIEKRLPLAFSETYLANPKNVEHLVQLRLSTPQPAAAYQAQLAAGAGFDLSEQVHQIEAPTLILAAEGDLVVPVANAYNLHEKIPGSKLRIYAEGGHQFFVEIPELFNRDVIEFLKAK